MSGPRRQDSPWTAGPVLVQEASASLVENQRGKQLLEKMSALFAVCADRCRCDAGSCPFKQGLFASPTQSPCSDSARCSVCGLFSRHVGLFQLLGKASATRGALFSQRLASSVAVHQLYDLAVPRELEPDQRRARKQAVKDLLCSMLDCQRNRLQCYRRIGELGILVPALLCVQLTSGRSLFWEQLRKVGNVVIGQASRQAKLTALEAIRRRLPSESPWKAFLTPPVSP